MRFKFLVVTIFLIAVPLATASAGGADRVRKSELKNHPFTVGHLRLTISTFRGNLRDVPTFVRLPGQIEVNVENLSSVAEVYSPQELALVGSDNKQVNLRGRMQQGIVNANDDRLEPLQARTIVPGAQLEEFYELTGPVRLPARLFYGGEELAIIAD